MCFTYYGHNKKIAGMKQSKLQFVALVSGESSVNG